MTSNDTSPEHAETFDEHQGRDAFRHTLRRIGVELSNGAFDKAFARMQQAADRDGAVSDAKLNLIVDEVVSGTEILQGVNDTFR